MAKPRPKEVHYSASSSGPSESPAPSSVECVSSEAATAIADPYLELELYFEKVNEEIGAVFERWHQTADHESYPDVVQQDGNSCRRKGKTRKKSASVADTNHLAEFERVVADELLALTPSDSSGTTSPSYGGTTQSGPCAEPASAATPALPDLLAVQQHVQHAKASTATSPLLKQKEVENFLRKVEHTILGQEVVENGDGNNAALDAGTQTQDLSRSSSVTWLSSSSLLDSPASAASHGGSTREESSSSTEDTSSSSEALLAAGGSASNTRTVCQETGDEWLRLRTAGARSQAQEASSGWNQTNEAIWKPRLSSVGPDCNAESTEPAARDGAASDNETTKHRKRKHQQTGRIAETVTSQQSIQSPSLSSLSSLRTNVAPVGTPLAPELATKSSSAPVLAKQQSCSSNIACTSETDGTFTSHRSHSERYLSEIEAVEACRWMRAAGFPQYAQMYEDLQFPVDLNSVQKDHPFLDRDALQALFRRLHVLNRCAKLRVDGGALAKNPVYDSDDEVECALSENWTFLHQSRRWSRIAPLASILQPQESQDNAADEVSCAADAAGAAAATPTNVTLPAQPGTSVSDNGGVESRQGDTEAVDVEVPDCPMSTAGANLRHYSSLPPGRCRGNAASDSEFNSSQTFRRSGSEKFRDGAKALLRRVESLKTRGKRPKPYSPKSEEQPFIGTPQVIDVAAMQDRMRTMNCVDIVDNSPTSGDATSGVSNNNNNVPLVTLDLESSSVASKSPPVTPVANKCYLRRPSRDADDVGTQSDTECVQWSPEWLLDHDAQDNHASRKDGGMSHSEPRRKSFRKRSQPSANKAATLAPDVPRHTTRPRHGKSERQNWSDRSPDKEEGKLTFWEQLGKNGAEKAHNDIIRGYSDSLSPDEDSSTASGTKPKTSVIRWHSFGRGNSLRRPSYRLGALSLPGSSQSDAGGRKVNITSLSCGQLMVLRQLAMLQLTTVLEKHCPALRSTGFNWELPKFMKKCKSPHKEQTMFGVSLISSLQMTGQALPPAIQAAMQHLTEHALDQVGLFRKPGVRSRIQKLRTQLINAGLNEPLNFTLEEQQAYDVADVVKQFFRELPEALLTSKLSDTFLAIFQYVPVSSRHEAVKWAVLLLPDQHREVLQFLLSFLKLVASHSQQNQMTASNLAVCLAPSLFHSSPLLAPADASLADSQRSASPRSRSKRRTKSASAGSPDAKELTESRAAHDCLLYLINNIDDLVNVSEELLVQCHFSSMEQSIPLPLGELGADIGQDWKGYMQACTTALIKEARERQRGWVAVSSADCQVEVSYKKVGDGHPLRIWRVSTEVEAPPAELLRRILRERYLWDPSLMNCRVLYKPELLSEVYHYVCASMKPLPPRDYCVLRSWRSDLPRGGCILVETSIDYPGSNELIPGTVQAIVLASRYLIEPCGSGRSRILHLSRVDTKGRSVEWYNKCYGHVCALNLTRMRASFTHSAEGPESKV